MKLIELSYEQYPNSDQHWKIEKLNFDPNINLIVGKNATGKTKIYNVIHNLTRLLSGLKKDMFTSGYFDVLFLRDDIKVRYLLEIKNETVVREEFWYGEERKLIRDKKGKGEIHYSEDNISLSLTVAHNTLAVVQKRDPFQHPEMEYLIQWSEKVLAFAFGTDMGKGYVLSTSNSTDNSQQDLIHLKDTTQVINRFIEGKSFPKFRQSIYDDMNRIGYFIEEITINRLENTDIRPKALFIKEKSIKKPIPQHELSQGMFRALALIIYVNYCKYRKNYEPNCILIDDIGEGLDYERSTALIELLVEKIESNQLQNVQLIMTSNDRFVMNAVDLKYWTLIERKSGGIDIYNFQNSRAIFEEFEFIGLSNFDFLSTEFYKGE